MGVRVKAVQLERASGARSSQQQQCALAHN